MAGYVSLPAAFTPAKARPWVAKSIEYVAGLSPKKKKPASKK